MAKRLLCLMSLAARAYLEGVIAKGGEAASEYHDRTVALVQWLRREGLWGALSAMEQQLNDKPVGSWSEREQLNTSWRVEAAGCIAWALGLVSTLPGYDQQFTPGVIIDAVPQTGDATADWVAARTCRDEDTIQDAREVAEMWMWRARTTQMQRSSPSRPGGLVPAKLDQIIVTAARHAEQEGRFTAFGDDFPAFGKSYRDLDQGQWQLASSIAHERLWAFNWLCGYHPNWDRVPLDT
jgi:hypothetical protein